MLTTALTQVVATSHEVTATSSRRAKAAAIADLLRDVVPEESAVVAAWLGGSLPQGRVGVGWRSLAELPPPAGEASLTVVEVDAAMTALAGEGGRAARQAILTDLFGRATEEEQTYLRGLLLGEVRQGSLDGVLLAAAAEAAEVPEAALRRASMLAGDLPAMVSLALREGEGGLAAVRLEPGRAIQPMLAGSAAEIDEVAQLVAGTEVALDTKVDGIRVQIHRAATGEIRVFTRSLDDITARVPELVEMAEALPATTVVLDGEAIALRPDGRPRPFQETGARTASRRSVEVLRAQTPLTPFVFDVLHLDGRDLLDEPYATRRQVLLDLVPEQARVPGLLTGDLAQARAFFEEAVASGHEGVVVKDLDAPYAAGRRGSAWTKVKPRHTLDLVVLAVEWGSGRRRGKLSNIHLGARGADGELVMVGKTFKGMTDEILRWQTERFLELETAREGHVVHVRPEQVVEVAIDGVQTSRRYPGGVALRFARVLRYRDDKPASAADTLETIVGLRG
ncbi:ATP-dependent DNA ligase [Marihabitans asiaticum]|uniref:DNA ligase B n=1 Tax=Marihabitans asiaticum TaxID=415218 RepID=A0A560W7P8_9MICO|nr:ATP-dependent DNA ligase [Marihabitans asiaticum]TWD13621.1 DNA ligase-1 [Marihabitans asiaticum]